MTRSYLGYVSSQTTDTIAAGIASSIPTIVTFTTTGANNYTVPAGVTYIVANLTGGGGGTSQGATSGGTGGTSSVEFAAGTITAVGGNPHHTADTTFTGITDVNITPNEYGSGGLASRRANSPVAVLQGGTGAFIRCGGAVTPGANLVVNVGAGGTAGTNGTAGRQGIVTLELYEGNSRRVELFKASGTFTPPAGVTRVMATIVGGGGSCGYENAAVAGGNSSVAFSSGTITADGGQGVFRTRLGFDIMAANSSAAANSGLGARCSVTTNYSVDRGVNDDAYGFMISSANGRKLLTSATVTPLSGITVTIGSGGNSSEAVGGSGVVWIEYTV